MVAYRCGDVGFQGAAKTHNFPLPNLSRIYEINIQATVYKNIFGKTADNSEGNKNA
jgi:hypothetical protein